jgi:DNA repair exonuclease SbcCD ATPase subunit
MADDKNSGGASFDPRGRDRQEELQDQLLAPEGDDDNDELEELEDFFRLDEEDSLPKIDQEKNKMDRFRDPLAPEEEAVSTSGQNLVSRVEEDVEKEALPRPEPEKSPEEERIERIRKQQEKEAARIEAEKRAEEEKRSAELAEAKRQEEEKIENIKKMIEEVGEEQERLGGALEELQGEESEVEEGERLDSFEKVNPTTSVGDDDQQQKQAQLAQVQGDIKKILRYQTPEEQIEVLTQISQEKGPVYAVELAEKLVSNNYVLDEVHGNLTGLRELLIAKGFLKEIR